MADETQEGELIRLLIENTNRSKLTTRKEVISTLKVERHNFNSAVGSLNKSLGDLGLVLTAPTSLYDSSTFFLTRTPDRTNKRAKGCRYSRKFYNLVILVTLMYLENKAVEVNRLLTMLRRIFDERDVDCLFSEAKRARYVKIVKENEEDVVLYGWRYYLDFVDFDPLEFFTASYRKEEPC